MRIYHYFLKTFKISYRYCDKLYETDRTIAEFKTLIKDINEFYDGLNFSYEYFIL